MGFRRKVLIGLTLLCIADGAVAFSAPMPCVAGTMADYMALAQGCTEGAFTDKSFVYNGPLPAGAIQVVPSNTGVGFLFLSQFAVAQGAKSVFQISYFEDPPPIIIGQEIDLDPIGAVTLSTVLCSVNTVPCPMGNTLSTLTATTGNPTASTALAGLSVLSLQNTLTLDGTNGAASSGGFDNITVTAPEPAGFLLAASGLLCVLTLRSRTKLRKILLDLCS